MELKPEEEAEIDLIVQQFREKSKKEHAQESKLSKHDKSKMYFYELRKSKDLFLIGVRNHSS